MKTIVMIRHAKAESGGFEDDFNRKLQFKGEKDAEAIGGQLQALGIIPQRVVASSATRAWQTASIFAQGVHFNAAAIEPWEAFYHGVTTQDLLCKVQETADVSNCIFIIGHNPTIHYLSYNLCADFDRDTPTCATAVLQFDVEHWSDIEARTGKLYLHLVPK